MRALQTRSRQTGDPIAHIVMSSLADTLDIDHSTLFQVSTSTALVEGV
jgi:acetolactate decarboxylase